MPFGPTRRRADAFPHINPDPCNSMKTPDFLRSISESISRFRRTFLAQILSILRPGGASNPMTVDATAPHPSFFARHEKLALVLVNVVLLALLLGASEVAARLSTHYEIGYYT